MDGIDPVGLPTVFRAADEADADIALGGLAQDGLALDAEGLGALTGFGQHADGSSAPERRRRIEALHVDAGTQDDAGVQEADTREPWGRLASG